MLTSLFGDLGRAGQGGSRPDEVVHSDGSLMAKAIAEPSTEAGEPGRADRHLRDVLVSGSPARAMRDHLAARSGEQGRSLVLFDPSRIWASAVVKALSDASGQPIERLHLREHDTLRTLAMVERTSIVRGPGDTLKVWHADVRASGRENAEISLTLMERAQLTAVIVGPMQPHAIDAMLNTLYEAAAKPSWRCASLLFLLPPGAVWIANKIDGIAWPDGLRVQTRSEPMSGASAVWNAVLGVWHQLKDERSGESPRGQPLSLGEGFPIRVADLELPIEPAAETDDDESRGPVTLVPFDAELTPSRIEAPLDVERAQQALTQMLLRSEGLLACAVVDGASGLVLAHEQRDGIGIDLDVAAAASAQALRAQRLAARGMGIVEHIDELFVSTGSRQQLLRVPAKHPQLFVFALFDAKRSNLALARWRLAEAEKMLG